MYSLDLSGKNALVFGVATHRSIAWHIAQALAQAGARLALTYQGERLRESVTSLSSTLRDSLTLECDVARDDHIARAFQEVGQKLGKLHIVIHSVAFAGRDEMTRPFSQTSRQGFQQALDVSAYSLVPIVRHAAELMPDGGSIIALTFQASERVFPGYNVMGTAKAALENAVRQLAAEFGPKNIRMNAISAGPLDTLAARGIPGFVDMKHIHAQRAPLKRNITHQEVANAALFLCSDLASGITGAVIPVDAGYHIMGA